MVPPVWLDGENDPICLMQKVFFMNLRVMCNLEAGRGGRKMEKGNQNKRPVENRVLSPSSSSCLTA